MGRRGQRGLLVLVGHISDTWGLAFDRTGTRIASTSRDSTVRLWDARTGRLERILHSGSVPYGVCFSPDAREIAVVCRDGAVRTFGVKSGERLAQLMCAERDGAEQIQGSLRYDPTGGRLYVVDHRRGIDAWKRTSDGWVLERHEPLPGANWLDLSPDGRRIAVATLEGALLVLELPDWTTSFVVDAHPGQIGSLAFHPNGDALATGGPDGVAKIWSVPGGELLRSLPVRIDSASEGYIEGIDFSPDGSRLACVLTGSGVALWDPERGEHVTTLEGPGRGYNQAVFDPTGRRIAGGSWGETFACGTRSRRWSAARVSATNPTRDPGRPPRGPAARAPHTRASPCCSPAPGTCSAPGSSSLSRSTRHSGSDAGWRRNTSATRGSAPCTARPSTAPVD